MQVELNKPVGPMTNDERQQLVFDLTLNPIPDHRWVYMRDMSVKTLTDLVWPGSSAEKLAERYYRLNRFYDPSRFGPENANRDISQMVAWWQLREHALPLILCRTSTGLNVEDGVHRLTHFAHTRSRESVPVLIGVPEGSLDQDGDAYEPKVFFEPAGEELVLRKDRYSVAIDSDRIGLTGYGADGPYARFTVNLPNEHLGRDEVFLKGWSECSGFPEALERAGVVKLTGRTVSTGHAKAQAAILLV